MLQRGRLASLVLVLAGAVVWLAAPVQPVCAQQVKLPTEKYFGNMEVVKTFNGPMPTGVTVSHKGRIFVNYPRWGDNVTATVAELVNGNEVPFQSDGLVSVQSVVVDANDMLWILDTGSIAFGPTKFGGPKLVGIDLSTNKVAKKILLPANVALPRSYLNDVRFDLRRGKGGMAYITDSSSGGGIIVVDLASGKSWRRLANHFSTKAEPGFLPVVEGQPLMVRPANKPPQHVAVGSDGIAISADGKRLFYCPLSSRQLYSVSVDALSNAKLTDAQVAKTVIKLGDKGGGADGLESDGAGNLYITNYEHNAIVRRNAKGQYETLIHDLRLMWPDTMCLASDGYLYFTVNQLHRQPQFHNSVEARERPYALMRTKIGIRPVTLKK